MTSTVCKIDLNTIKAGLSHQKSNFIVLLKYCYSNSIHLIKPIFILSGYHNNNKEISSDLSEYFDLDNIHVDGKPFTLLNDSPDIDYTIPKQHYNCGLLRTHSLFINTPAVSVDIPYIAEINNIAQIIKSRLGNDYMCIHVRRGDKITNAQLDKDTQTENIVSCIAKFKPSVVYIMTNKTDELKTLTSTSDYIVYFYNDFDVLKKIENNYYLFCVENVIMNLATVRCSTFFTSRDYYHCSLSNITGHQ